VVDTHRGDFCEQFRTIAINGGDNVRRLISIAVIIAILTAMLIPALAGGMIIGGGGGGGSSRIYSKQTFYDNHSGASVGGSVRAYETPYREIKLNMYGNCVYWNHYISRLDVVVALWREADPNNVMYKTYESLESKTPAVGRWEYALSVKQEAHTFSPDWGLAYYRATGYRISPLYRVYAIKFTGSAPEIHYMGWEWAIPELQDLYRIFLQMADIWG
jgi:hypothetical protein